MCFKERMYGGVCCCERVPEGARVSDRASRQCERVPCDEVFIPQRNGTQPLAPALTRAPHVAGLAIRLF